MKELIQKAVLTNSFTISGSGKTCVSHNTVVDLAAALNTWNNYAKYIAAGTGDALSDNGLGNLLICKETQLDEYNSDPSQGELFAAYSIILTDDDVAEGTVVSEAGLTPFDYGKPLVNYAAFEGVTKRKGQNIVIRAEVRLSLVSDKLRFVSGKNKMAEIFLGMNSFSGHRYEMAHGTNYHKTAVMPRTATELTEKYDTGASTSDNKLIMKARFTTSPYEIIIILDGKPVLRGFFSLSAHVESLSGTLRYNSSVEIVDRHILQIYNVKNQGTAVAEVYVLPFVSRVTKDCPQPFPFKLPKNSRFITEPSGAFTAVVNDKEISVYKFSDNRAEFLYTVKGSFPASDICSDGSLFTGGEVLTAYFWDGQEAVKKEFTDYKDVTGVYAVKEAGSYEIAFISSGAFYIIYYTAGEVTVVDSLLQLPEDFGFIKHDVKFIDYWSASQALFKSVGVSGTNSNNADRLKFYLTSAHLHVYEIGGRWIRLRNALTDAHVLAIRETSTTFKLDNEEEVGFCGEYTIIYKGDKLSRIAGWSGSLCVARELPFDGQADRPVSQTVFGDYILLLYADGTVTAFYPVEYGKVLFCPYSKPYTGITYEAVVADDPMAGGVAVDAEFSLDYGGAKQ